MSTLFEQMFELRAAYDNFIEEHGEEALKEAFKTFFDTYPEVKAVTWTQYTPYFNDGDACNFFVNDFEIDDEYEDDEDCDEDEYEDDEDDDQEAVGSSFTDAYKALSILQSSIPDDVLLNVFGDHMGVTATRDGFNSYSIDHD